MPAKGSSGYPIRNLRSDLGHRGDVGPVRTATRSCSITEFDHASCRRSVTALAVAAASSLESNQSRHIVETSRLYGRVEFSRSWLDGFTETGGGNLGLTYGDQTIDTLSGVFGMRANYAFEMDWGTLTPGVRAEYTHDFQGSSRASLGYTDLGGLPYAIEVDPDERDHVTLGLSLDFQFDNAWNLGLDYRTSFGGSGNQDHVLGAKLGVRF